MKKQKLKNLLLKRETISNLDSQKIKGGEAMTFGAICIVLSFVYDCDDTINCPSNYPCHYTDTIP